MTRVLSAALCATMLSAGMGEAADSRWVEIRSSHFTVWSDGNKGDANGLLWQLEQIRAAVKAQWPVGAGGFGKAHARHCSEGRAGDAIAGAVVLGSDTLQAMQKDLSRAIELHPFFAAAYTALGEVRFLMKQPSGAVIPQIAKAISLEPSSPWHRLTAARVLGRMGNLDEARKAAEAALRLADTDEARQQAQQMLAVLPK